MRGCPCGWCFAVTLELEVAVRVSGVRVKKHSMSPRSNMDLAGRLGVADELLGVRRSPACGVVADRNSYARIRDTIS